MSDRRFELDQIYDLPALSPSADHTELLQHQQREDQWRRTREPVAAGSKFLKFITWQDLIDQGLVTESDVIGDDSGGTTDDGTEVELDMVIVYARDMYPSTTDGSDPLAIVEVSSAKPNLRTIDFPASGVTSAQFALLMPPGWVGGTFQYRVYWSHPSGATTFGVAWELRAHSATDGESLVPDFVTGTTTTDTGGTQDTLYITPESGAVPISGTLAKAGDLVLFEIIRQTGNDGDTLDAAARLHAIRFNVGAVPAEFPPAFSDPYAGYAVLHLPMTGADGSTTITDLALAGRSMVARNGAAIDDAIPGGGTALLLDGSDDYLDTNIHTSLDVAAATFALEAIVHPDSLTSNPYIYSTRHPNPYTSGMALTINSSGVVGFVAWNTSLSLFVTLTGGTVATGTRTHIEVNRSGDTWRLFVGGVLVDSDTVSGTVSSGGNLHIGKSQFDTGKFDGWIVGVRLSKPPAVRTADFVPPSDLVPV